MSQYLFRLYLNADPEDSDRACQIRDQVVYLLQSAAPPEFELEVINVLADPDRAEADGILATPTLVKIKPSPVQQVIGSFSDPSRVLPALELAQPPAENGKRV
ncbi:circadian clock KaiB family protein [Thiohalorhabdus methylotrophus]|uniref:Circadian clock KaiB family protein n=1 Tax=Thiohalorhabdus methylotrophus TaxID=3242694 RepID=A0ABV4TS60_9GAMM